MNNIDSVISIERNKLKEFQSQMDKYISNINKFRNNINSNNLVEILILNQEIDKIINLIQNNDKNILYDNKNSLNEKNRQVLQNYDNSNKIISKYLPYMLLESMSQN
tara:strand:+ start:529 stop:849 length:321 start_codon:yes stop_codon:yes gene_type:complete